MGGSRGNKIISIIFICSYIKKMLGCVNVSLNLRKSKLSRKYVIIAWLKLFFFNILLFTTSELNRLQRIKRLK